MSTDKQTVENQRFEILKYSSNKRIHIDQWIEEVVSGSKRSEDRKLGKVLKNLNKNDILIVSELSRLGRNLMEVMSILHTCMEKESKVHAIKEGYELGNNISSKVLAFAFSLSAEIERKFNISKNQRSYGHYSFRMIRMASNLTINNHKININSRLCFD